MSKTHPVVFSFGGAEHHLTLKEAQSAIGRLNDAIGAAMAAQDRGSRLAASSLAAISRRDEANQEPIRRLAIQGHGDLWLTDDGQGTDESQDFTGWGDEPLVTWCEDEREAAEYRANDVYCKRYRAKVAFVLEYPGGVYKRDVFGPEVESGSPPVDRSRRCTVGEAVAPGVPNTEDRGDGQQKGYVILCDEERAKGFVRPVRGSYIHVGARPKYPTRDLTHEEAKAHEGCEYLKFEAYPEGSPERGRSSVVGRFWTAAQLRSGCGTLTTMGQKLAETYARDPGFYSGTFCCGCGAHFPVGAAGEFVWDGTDERVGT